MMLGSEAEATATVTLWLALPPAPLHSRVKTLSCVNEPTVCVPAVARFPDQAPEALHESAFCDNHVSVVTPLYSTAEGSAAIVMLGGKGEATAIATLWLILPPAPVHSRINRLSWVSGPTVSIPAVPRTPDQSPEALHDVASFDDHVSIAVPLKTTDE